MMLTERDWYWVRRVVLIEERLEWQRREAERPYIIDFGSSDTGARYYFEVVPTQPAEGGP